MDARVYPEMSPKRSLTHLNQHLTGSVNIATTLSVNSEF